ncbi:MAG: malate dehydrogenase [Planctomycetota bacterium]
MRKIGILGGGHVGATAAFVAAQRELGDVALYDILEGVPAGKALDMAEAAPVLQYDARVTGSHEPSILAGCDVVIVAAGFPRKPGMDRMDLLRKNMEIARSAGSIIREHAPDAVVITVTNPLDVMTWVVQQTTGFAPSRVVGMAGMLDSARFSAFLSMEIGCSPKDVKAMVLGGHGDNMVPLPRYSTVNGITVTELVPADRLQALMDRTRKGGGEIVKLLGTGSAYYAPGCCAVLMAEAVMHDSGRVMPCSTWVDGPYGLHGVYVGLPVALGKNGVERIVEIDLTEEESDALKASAASVAKGIEDVKSLG